MKRQIFTAAGLLLAGIAVAQTQQGNGILSGDVSVGYNRTDFSQIIRPSFVLRTVQPRLNLTAGRFVKDNWLLGITASLSSSSTRTEATSTSSPLFGTIRLNNVEVALTPFVRKYWQFSPVQVFVGAGLSAGLINTYQQTVANDNGRPVPGDARTNQFTLNPLLEAGVNYFVTNRLGLQLSALANSLPFNTGGLRAGLVYWTGPDRRNAAPESRDNPQTNRGNWLIEGGFSISRSVRSDVATGVRNTRDEQTIVNFSPSVGYFLAKNTAVGIGFPITYNRRSNTFRDPLFTNSSDSNEWSIGISPYVQRYWTSTRLTPYTRIGATYQVDTDSPGIRQRSLSGNVSLGLAYMAGQRFIIETSLASLTAARAPLGESGDQPSTWNASISAGLSGNFAIRYVVNRPR